MPPPPTQLLVLVCDAVAFRLPRVAEAIERLSAALSAEERAGLRLGFRPAQDRLVLLCPIGRRPRAERLQQLQAAAALQGLRELPLETAGMPHGAAEARAIAACPKQQTFTTRASLAAWLEEGLGLVHGSHHEVRLGAALQLRWADETGFLEAWTSELAQHGAWIRTRGPPPPLGRALPLELYVPGEPEPVRAIGTVVRHGEERGREGFGVSLALGGPAQDRLALAARRLGTRVVQDARRKDARVPVRLRVELGTGEALLREYTTNLSRGGAFVATQSPPPMGTRLPLVVALPDGTELELAAEVVRVFTKESAAASGGVAGCGVAFLDPAAPGLATLGALVDALVPREKRHVLFANGARSARRAILEELTRRDCDVHEVGTGAALFEALLDELLGLDLLVLDRALPDVAAEELLARIRRLGGETELPIAVLVPASEPSAGREALLAAGADLVLEVSLGPVPAVAQLLGLLHGGRPQRLTGGAGIA